MKGVKWWSHFFHFNNNSRNLVVNCLCFSFRFVLHSCKILTKLDTILNLPPYPLACRCFGASPFCPLCSTLGLVYLSIFSFFCFFFCIDVCFSCPADVESFIETKGSLLLMKALSMSPDFWRLCAQNKMVRYIWVDETHKIISHLSSFSICSLILPNTQCHFQCLKLETRAWKPSNANKNVKKIRWQVLVKVNKPFSVSINSYSIVHHERAIPHAVLENGVLLN